MSIHVKQTFLPANITMTRGTVLIAEHHEQLRNKLALLVRNCGFDVLIAVTGEEAIAALSTTDIDIIMANLALPRLDGYGLLHWMHEHSLTQPVLIINTTASLEGTDRALRLGAYDYVTYPFEHEQIEAALERAEASIERRRAEGLLRRRHRELAALNAISTAVNSSLELDEMLDRALIVIVDALELSGVLIYLGDADHGVKLYRNYGTSVDIATRIARTYTIHNQTGVALGAAQIAHLLGNVEQVVWYGNDVLQAVIPLSEQGRLCGLLLLVGAADTPIHHDQLALLESIGNYISVAIANARLYAEVRDSAMLMEQLVARRTQELQQSRDLLRTIFDGIPGGLLLADTRRQVLAVNRAYANLLDQQPETLQHQTYDQIWSAPWAGSAAQLVQRCLSAGQPTYLRESMQPPGRTPAILDHYLFPVSDETGQVIQVIEYLEDVTERLTLEQAVTQSQQLVALGKLAATVAHEVNTPLLAIRGCLGLIANPHSSPTARAEYLALAESELDRAASIIRTTLEFYQSSGNERRATDINALVERVVSLVQARCLQQHIEVEQNLAPLLPAVFIVPDQLKQVLLNLTLNVIEVLPEGGRMMLRTALHAPGAHTRLPQPASHTTVQPSICIDIEIEDTQRPMPGGLTEQVFDTIDTTGNGDRNLGLTICRTIVQKQGGSIRFASLPEGGACFTIMLPAALETTPAG